MPGIPWEDINDKHVVSFQGGEYRIKPEPKLRPWRPDEVPVGAVVRIKGDSIIRCLICSVDKLGIMMMGFSQPVKFRSLLADWELLDGSPCGVEEEVGE